MRLQHRSGALWIRRSTAILPQVHGGSQERYRRAGTENVPGLVPVPSSEMYARNIWNLISDMIDKEGNFSVNLEDEAIDGCAVIREGTVRHEPTLEALGEKGGE